MTEDLQIACPDAEELAEYVEGRLNRRARARVETHLADCEMCRDVVAETLRLGGEAVGAGTVLPFWRRPQVRAIGGGVLALAASLLLLVQVQPQLNPFRGPTPYQELVAAVGTNRSIEGRLSGGFRYGPYQSPTRGSGDLEGSDYAVLAAVARIQEVAKSSEDPELLHALGIGRLVLKDYDLAISSLETAAAARSTVEYQSDLSAAYLARARALGRADDYPKALAAAQRALAVAPDSPAALFNQALALESLDLSDRAKESWRHYLEVAGTDEWADEARQHLATLDNQQSAAPSPAVETDRQFTRETLEVHAANSRRGESRDHDSTRR